MSCSVAGCDRTNIAARGLCRKHYLRWYKHGDPEVTLPRSPLAGKRGAVLYEAGLHNSTPLETPCREWPGYRTEKGYGIYKRRRIHRWVWEQAHGAIAAGLVVMHRCDNPPCFRLSHLRLGTIAENQQDMKTKGRGGNASTRKKETQNGK